MAKYISHYSGKRIDRSVGMIPDTNPTEDGVLVISKAGEGSYKKVSEVGATVVQATGDSETQVMSQKAVTNALGTKADKQSVEGMISDLVVQETGKATDKVMSQDATTKELNKKLNLIEPTGVQTDYVMVKKWSDGTIEQVQETGIFTPGTSYSNFTPVLRGLQGQLKGQTPELKDQDNLDLINRKELTEKLSEVGGGLKWVDYSAAIQRKNIFAVMVGIGQTAHEDGSYRFALPPVFVYANDNNSPEYGTNYSYDLYREDYFKTGGKGNFRLNTSGTGYSQTVTLYNQTMADGANYDWNVCEIMKMLVKE